MPRYSPVVSLCHDIHQTKAYAMIFASRKPMPWYSPVVSLCHDIHQSWTDATLVSAGARMPALVSAGARIPRTRQCRGTHATHSPVPGHACHALASAGARMSRTRQCRGTHAILAIAGERHATHSPVPGHACHTSPHVPGYTQLKQRSNTFLSKKKMLIQ